MVKGKRKLFLIPLASFAALSVALISQYGFGLHPCELCQYQRVPYGLAILLGVMAALKFVKKRKVIFFGYFLLMICESALAFYHVMVEKGYFKTTCSGGSGSANDTGEMLNQILAAPAVFCNQVQFEFIHISMAGWNGIFSILLAALALISFSRGSHAAG